MYEKELVHLYHERICNNGVTEYTFDECWTDYLKGFLILAITPIGAFSNKSKRGGREELLKRQTLHRWFTAILDNDATSILPG